MPAPTPAQLQARLDRVRQHMRAAAIDTLLVSSLPNVQYLTGFRGSAGALILYPSDARLLVDFRYVTVGRGIVDALDPGLRLEVVDRTFEAAVVASLVRQGSLRVGIEAAHLPVARFNALSAGLAAASPAPARDADPSPTLVPTERIVERARAVKDAAEVAVLREGAARISAIARDLPFLARAGRSELEVARVIEAAMRDAGFSRPAFDTIVAAGPNSALPHARPSERRLSPGDATVLDFGGVYDGYCVDLTRTVQLGAPSPDLERLYEAVAEAQAAAIAAVRPGASGPAVDAAARDLLTARGLGEAFGHGTGHGIGLEVHEEPRIARAVAGAPDEPLVAGMVFTIEPGAYVPGLGGVRIEDDVLVTETGCELLTDAPRLF